MPSGTMTRSRVATTAGYMVLISFTILLYVGAMIQSYGHGLLVPMILKISVIGVLVELVREYRVACCTWSEESRFIFPRDSMTFLSVLSGTVVTYWFSVDLGLGAVVASSLVGVFVAAFLKPYAAAAFCGSFVGMASAELFTYSTITLAGVLAGLIFVLCKHALNGFGGKLGTVAWAGCVFTVMITGQPMLTGSIPGWDIGGALVVFCVLGALITYSLSVSFGQGPVMASGMVGLAGGLLLPALYGPVLGHSLAVGVFCASFAGMSATTRSERAYWMIPAGVLCALILMYGAPFLGGGGGKLGTTAFGAVIGTNGLIRLARYLGQTVSGIVVNTPATAD